MNALMNKWFAPRRMAGFVSLVLGAALMAGCGGGSDSGGGGSGGGGGGGVTPGTATISGVADFESVPATNTGPLNYGAIAIKPIRGAAVEAIAVADGSTLASSITSATGSYTLTFSGIQAVKVRVKAQMNRTGSTGGQWDFSVRDNTNTNALYVMDSTGFTPNNGTGTTQNVRATTGWGGSGYTGTRVAAPFSVLDAVYDASQKVLSASPNAAFPALSLFWSVNNRPVAPTRVSDYALGNIGTTFFQSTSTTKSIYVLGAENTDTDEFDRHVIAHEFGHYLQSAFSRDDSIGGSHSGGDKLDMRVAFSEGWGNAWSGMALGNAPFYTDSAGTRQAAGFAINLAAAPTSNLGWYSEASVQYLLWQWGTGNAVGFTPVFNVLAAMRTTLPADGAVSSIHAFASRLKAANPGAAASIDSLLATQNITVNSAIGAGETNNGGLAQALPVYVTHTAALGAAQNYCVNAALATSGGAVNKLGASVFIRFTLAAAATRTITVSATTTPTLSDPDFELFRNDGTQTTFEAGGTGAGETGTSALAAGTHVVVLYDYALAAGSGSRCFNLTIQ